MIIAGSVSAVGKHLVNKIYIWRLNTQLLYNHDYIVMIQNQIKYLVSKYVPWGIIDKFILYSSGIYKAFDSVNIESF